VVLLAFAVWALRTESDPTFLADGTRTSHTFALPELMRVAYNAKHLEIFGFHWVKVIWGALFLAFGLVMPLFPLHFWLKGALRVLPMPASLLLGGGVVGTGIYGLVRVSTGILPDGSRWAATTVAAFGVLNLAFAVVALFRAKAMGDGLLALMVGHVGFSLVGFGGLSREGIAACLLGLVSQGLLVTLLIATTSPRTPSIPLLRALRGLAVFGLAGTPGLGGFWAELMSVMGVLPVERIIGFLTAAAAAMLGYGVLRLFFMSREEEAEDSSPLTPEGARALVALVPVALLALALGVSPAPFLALVQGGVSDVNQLVNPPGPDEIALAD
jgi:NADH:ubiquinone oxidoreductase subunit 4 (subunit M)